MILLALSLLLTTENWPLPIEPQVCRQAPAPDRPDGAHPVFLPSDDNLVPAIFPTGALDPFMCRWFSYELYTLGDGPLEPETGTTLYRFTRVRSFDVPMRYSLALQDNGSAGRLDWVIGAMRNGEHASPLTGHRELTDAETAELRTRATGAAVCTIGVTSERCGVDGEEWLYESVIDADYCFAYRWTPPEGEFRSFGAALIELVELPH